MPRTLPNPSGGPPGGLLPPTAGAPAGGRTETLLALAVGCLAFAAFGGWRILDPTRTAWLYQGDFAQHWLGWQFFRETPLLQFPLGRNDNWGLEIGSTIVFTDSIPLLALAFKAFSAWLPRHFQYFGLWVLAGTLLQAALGARLLRRLGADAASAVLGCAFFALAPPMLFRLQGHMALSAHWTLLAALLLALGRAFRPGRWLALLAAGLLVHAYLFAMLFALFLADLARRTLHREAGTARLAGALAAALALSLGIMAVVGYFAAGESGAGGFGVFRLNLNALFNPLARWSAFLPAQPEGYGDFEGFNYLGLGGLAAVLLAGALRLPRGRRTLPPLAPLAVCCALLTLFALSDHVALGRQELLHYQLPPVLERAASTFRSSGRFFWPPFYLLLALSLSRIAVSLRPRAAHALLAALALTQWADLRPGLAALDALFAQPPAFSSPLKSPFWAQAARPGGTLLRIPPENLPEDWIAFSSFAMDHALRTNFGVFARVSESRLLAYGQELASAALEGRLEPGAIHVVHGEALWAALLARGQEGFAGVVDGFNVFVPGGAPPGWPRLDGGAARQALERMDVGLGQELRFGAGLPGLTRLADGWHDPHADGVWAAGRLSRLVVRLDPVPGGDVLVEVTVQSFVLPPYNDRQTLEVSLEGQDPQRWTFRDGGVRTVAYRAGADAVARAKGLLVLRLVHPDAVSLRRAGLFATDRRISFQLKALTVRTADGPPTDDGSRGD